MVPLIDASAIASVDSWFRATHHVRLTHYLGPIRRTVLGFRPRRKGLPFAFVQHCCNIQSVCQPYSRVNNHFVKSHTSQVLTEMGAL